MHGKVLLVTDIVEIEHHGHAEELIAHLAHNGSATCNNGLGEMVVQSTRVSPKVNEVLL